MSYRGVCCHTENGKILGIWRQYNFYLNKIVRFHGVFFVFSVLTLLPGFVTGCQPVLFSFRWLCSSTSVTFQFGRKKFKSILTGERGVLIAFRDTTFLKRKKVLSTSSRLPNFYFYIAAKYWPQGWNWGAKFDQGACLIGTIFGALSRKG